MIALGNRGVRRLLGKIKKRNTKIEEHEETISWLRARIENLQNEVEGMEFALTRAQEATARAHRAASGRVYEIERLETEASRRRYDLEDATRDLARAKECGDRWACEKAMRRLKSLS